MKELKSNTGRFSAIPKLKELKSNTISSFTAQSEITAMPTVTVDLYFSGKKVFFNNISKTIQVEGSDLYNPLSESTLKEIEELKSKAKAMVVSSKEYKNTLAEYLEANDRINKCERIHNL